MILVIGGAFQGKKDYAAETFHLTEEDFVDGKTAEMEQLLEARAIAHFHDFIRKKVRKGKDVEKLAMEIAAKNPDVIILVNEMGYGVVPADAFDREYRETVGNVCTALARRASEVHRVVCGIGMVLRKD